MTLNKNQSVVAKSERNATEADSIGENRVLEDGLARRIQRKNSIIIGEFKLIANSSRGRHKLMVFAYMILFTSMLIHTHIQ